MLCFELHVIQTVQTAKHEKVIAQGKADQWLHRAAVDSRRVFKLEAAVPQSVSACATVLKLYPTCTIIRLPVHYGRQCQWS